MPNIVLKMHSATEEKKLCLFELQLERIIWYWCLIHLFLDTTKGLYSPSYYNVRRESSVHFLLLTPQMLHLLWVLCLRNKNICSSVGKPNSGSMEYLYLSQYEISHHCFFSASLWASCQFWEGSSVGETEISLLTLPTVLDSMIHWAYLEFQLEGERGSYLFHSFLLQYVCVFWIGIVSDKIKQMKKWNCWGAM